MSRFYTLTIAEVQRETPDCISLTFDLPDALRPLFRFKAGQHLTVRTTINNLDVRRTYSLFSAPHEGKWSVAIKRVEGGLFSTFANNELRVGDTLDVMPPAGHFIFDDQNLAKPSRHYLAIGAGSGITPLLSIIKTALETEPNCSVTLLYGNKQTSSIIFKEALEGLKNRFLRRFAIFYFLTEEQTESDFLNGRIDAQKLDFFFTKMMNPRDIDAHFLCGPQEMVEIAKTLLQEKGVEPTKIHFELFGTTAASQYSRKNIEHSTASSLVTVKDAGKTFTFKMSNSSSDSLLDAALKQGADLPFACKGGVCCTCKARLLEGEVEMAVHYALSPQEVAAGFILTCQAYPKTVRVSVDFDQALS